MIHTRYVAVGIPEQAIMSSSVSEEIRQLSSADNVQTMAYKHGVMLKRRLANETKEEAIHPMPPRTPQDRQERNPTPQGRQEDT